jgi:hypothetical protein
LPCIWSCMPPGLCASSCILPMSLPMPMLPDAAAFGLAVWAFGLATGALGRAAGAEAPSG